MSFIFTLLLTSNLIPLTFLSYFQPHDTLSYQKQYAKGYVYHDKNENLSMDNNEIGISGVYVSNGVEIVRTDKDGKYKIPVSDDAIIFVIKPRDWMTPINDLNLPQFYYIHKPNGSPSNFTFKGVDATGPLPNLSLIHI